MWPTGKSTGGLVQSIRLRRARELLQHSDHQMRLSVRLNETLPPLVIRAVKRLARWGRPGRLYSSLSLYSAYSPEPNQVATAGGPRQ